MTPSLKSRLLPALPCSRASSINCSFQGVAEARIDRLLGAPISLGRPLREIRGAGTPLGFKGLVIHMLPDQPHGIGLFGADLLGEKRRAHGLGAPTSWGRK